MHFNLTPAQQDLRQATRAFANAQLLPQATAREAAHDIPKELIAELGGRGLLGVNIPKALGGSEAGVVAYAVALREVARGDASVAVTMAVTNMVAEVIYRFGSDAQKKKHIPKLTSGEYFGGAFALSEPGAGSDAASLATRAERDGDDWLLTGEKMWISSGDRAGVLVVWARTGAHGARGISCFLVEGGASGLTAGKPEDKMGLRASHTVPLSFDRVRVPDNARLGELGAGFPVAMAALDGGRIGIGAQSLGIGSAALERARRYALDAGLSEEERVQFRFADMATELDAAWLLTLRAARLKEEGIPFSLEAAMAKVYSSEAANRVVRSATELCGAAAVDEELGLARLVRDCRVTQIYEGTSEVQRLVISRAILQQQRS